MEASDSTVLSNPPEFRQYLKEGMLRAGLPWSPAAVLVVSGWCFLLLWSRPRGRCSVKATFALEQSWQLQESGLELQDRHWAMRCSFTNISQDQKMSSKVSHIAWYCPLACGCPLDACMRQVPLVLMATSRPLAFLHSFRLSFWTTV